MTSAVKVIDKDCRFMDRFLHFGKVFKNATGSRRMAVKSTDSRSNDW